MAYDNKLICICLNFDKGITKMNLNLDLKIKPLTRTELYQMMSYCMWAEEDGYYLGNEKQFRKRHENIKAFLNDAINKLEERSNESNN